jgi:hypothetical protein
MPQTDKPTSLQVFCCIIIVLSLLAFILSIEADRIYKTGYDDAYQAFEHRFNVQENSCLFKINEIQEWANYQEREANDCRQELDLKESILRDTRTELYSIERIIINYTKKSECVAGKTYDNCFVKDDKVFCIPEVCRLPVVINVTRT